MSTSVTKNISEISISQPTHTLTITNNNTGNIVTVTPFNNPKNAPGIASNPLTTVSLHFNLP